MERGWINKRGQLTVFIVIAIVLVVGGATAFLIMKNSSKNSETNQNAESRPDLNKVESFSIECIKDSATQSLETIGIQGGYFTKPASAMDLGWAFIPYYFNQGRYNNT